MRVRSITVAVVALAASLLAPGPAQALELEQIGSFANPIYVTSPHDDPGRIFVVERAGRVKLLEGGVESAYFDISERVGGGGERGLSSIAFDPEYAVNGRIYVAYTTSEDTAELNVGDIVVEELTEQEPPAAPFAFRRVLVVPHSDFNIHNGGQLQFAPDGMLYLSTGDGGGYDPREQPQEIGSGLGKILRFDPQPDPPLGYTAPEDNPFAGEAGFAPLVWAMGLRNPFRFSFDGLTGDLAIGDVGEGTREEVDWAPSPTPGVAGGEADNYGWSCREGGLAGLGAGDPFCAGLGAADFDSPVFEYDHVTPNPEKGVICSGSIIGGYVVRDGSLGDLYGRYVYADYCTGEIRSLQLPSTPGGVATGDCSLGLPVDHWTSFGEDALGRLYVSSNKGGVYRFSGPLETCVADAGESGGGASSPAPEPNAQPGVPRLRIEARRLRGRPPRILLAVTVSPCAGQASRLRSWS